MTLDRSTHCTRHPWTGPLSDGDTDVECPDCLRDGPPGLAAAVQEAEHMHALTDVRHAVIEVDGELLVGELMHASEGGA